MSPKTEPAGVQRNGLEIAIVGMAGRFPSADDVEQLWQLLRDGRDGTETLADEALLQAGVAPEQLARADYVRRCGIVRRKHLFDAALFMYNAQDAASMDPQFAVFHEVVWEALENAGYDPGKFDGAIGLFAGMSSHPAAADALQAGESLADLYSASSLTEATYLSTRVAHRLDLTGPALSTNTACSTSLVNIHLACQSLITGECDLAVAGGVCIHPENTGFVYQEDMVLSPDGVCRAFDAAANGTASGEGCGVLVLRRLEDALADNDTVLAIIKGSAINNDGRQKAGFTAPSSDGQAKVIRRALDRAELGADAIDYVEAHGTGTRLGDPIEVAALKQVFEADGAVRCGLGSIKTNIGHVGEAAGVASAIKMVLSLRHGQLPPTLHFEQANPLIGLESSPFYVHTRLAPWQRRGELPRRAGVSSFGVGGTNAHIILEEAEAVAASSAARAHQMVMLSANTPAALQAREAALIAYARQHPQQSIADICYTLQVGRKDLPYRKAFVVGSTAELGAADTRTGLVAEGRFDGATHALCFMFPGQGAQYRDMGRELYERDAIFRETLDHCFALARRHSPLDLKAALYPQDAGAPAALDATELAQPLLFCFEYALARSLMHWGCRPSAYIGHSIGEYVAACLAGVFELEDAIAIVVARGRLVQSLARGAMLAVPLSEVRVQSLLADGTSIAAVNAPERVVVAGDIDAIERLRDRLAAQQVESVRLPTSHAFHSSHMDAVLGRFREVVQRATLSAPHTPFISNVSGNWIDPQEATSPDYWVRHLRAPVRFAQGIATLAAEAAPLLVEVGPGNALAGFAARREDAAGAPCISLVPPAKARVPGADDVRLLEGLCQLFVHGVAFDWRHYYATELRRRIPLPTYPFEGTPRGQASCAGSTAPATAQGVDESLTPVQARLREIWKHYLGVEQIDLHEDLFSLGVDSLLSIRVINEIREAFDAEISLDTIFNMRTIAELAEEITRKVDGGEELSILPIRLLGHGGSAPLSSSQQRLWIISQLELEHSAYNTGFYQLIRNLNVAAMERAIRGVIERHSILRTVYAEVDGVPMQRVLEQFEFQLEVDDLSHIADPIERRQQAQELWQRVLQVPIDLRKDLMLRSRLARYSEDTYLLMVTQHHICSDNWSNTILMNELGLLYEAFSRGEPDPLPPLPVQYIDYALWQSDWLKGPAVQQQIPYWRKKLAGIPQVHNLPLDRPRPKYQSYRGMQYFTKAAPGTLAGLNRLGQQHDTTLFMTMQAALSVFLARYSGENDIVIGFSVANRLHRELEGLIGFFVNVLNLRSDLSGNPSFADFLQQTKKNLLEAYSNAYVPFEVLVDELKPARSTSYEPITQIKLIYLDQSVDHQVIGMMGERTEWNNVVQSELQASVSKYDLTLYFSAAEDGELSLMWEYATDLFDATTIHRMAAAFEALLRSIAKTPYLPVRSLKLLAEPEAESGRRKQSSQDAQAFNFSLFYFANDDGEKTAGKYELLLEGARFADRHGFDAVWMPERHFDTFGGLYPNPAITAAAVASVTRQIGIRAGSCVLPLHHPVRVAEDWSVIDNISGGRVGIGFAAGYSPRDFSLAPAHYEGRREVLMQGIQTVKALWRGDDVTLPGGDGEAHPIRIRPRPLQNELPVWVTTVGSEEAFRHAGRSGDNLLTILMGQSLDELGRKIAIYRQARAEAGHRGEGTVTLLVHAFITDDEATVFAHVKEPFKRYLVDSLGTPQALARTLGLGDLDTSAHRADIEALAEFAFQRYYRSNALLGTAERCLPLVESIRQAGVNELACLVDFGVDPQLVLQNLPRLRQLRDLAMPGHDFGTLPEPEATLASSPGAPAEACLHQLFAQCAAADPDATAVVCEGEQISYGELDRWSNRIAHCLIQRYGAGPDRRFGLCVERSIAMLAGLLGILKAGAAYVPMEPSYPRARIAQVVAASGADVVLTRSADQQALDESPAARLPLDHPGELADYADTLPQTSVRADHLAYVIYTSGSTGQPKGVAVEHRAAVNFWRVMAATTHAGCAPHTKIGLNASIAFDMSLKGVLQLLSGHCVYLIPQAIRADGDKLLRFIRQHRIEWFDSTPSQIAVLLTAGLLDAQGWRPSTVLLGGEPINEAMWRVLRASPHTRFFNMYGPTECTVDATIGLIRPDDDVPHIGVPIANVQVHLLDEYGQPVPAGAIGEIHIGGAGLARGYLDQPELTQRSFIPDPQQPPSAQARLYRTGDFGRWLDDGRLIYMGRNDLQVKLRGFRVELGAIESQLMQHPDVRHAAVLALGEDSAKYLVAYLVIEGQGVDEKSLVAELKRSLGAVLPNYMVPQSYAVLPALPLTANGKLDRDALCRQAIERPSDEHVAPRTDTEHTLAAIWSELMGKQSLSVRADFFELGGQSLLAIRVVNEIIRRLQIELEVRYIFEHSTIESLAGLVDDLLAARQLR
ncbi:non-ribosomal peptide synthetase/type I polyketide synthase [Dyella acidiphila]|uniref:Amino acid adenylation domain-containing protein n=1 Tax=Dyella acidiphila TaxID=2775866 RepID=A0ABR9GDB4_9GAMM|nr:non-ribosomal peptide synthetase/type I polyketide synthase [Dyella acidiphila]MBE1162042.1 amino acid adenylation domain-containing protein [Dyella acidiphila]